MLQTIPSASKNGAALSAQYGCSENHKNHNYIETNSLYHSCQSVACHTPTETGYKVSLYPSVFQTEGGRAVSLATVMRAIRKGRWRIAVELARIEYQAHGKTPTYAERKGKLPCFTPAGTFKHRAIGEFSQASGIVQGDLDGLNARQLGWALHALKNDRHIVYVFISPSAAGIKYGFRIPTVQSNAEYRSYFFGACHYARRCFGFQPDEQNEAISQACYISYDQDAYFNPHAELFTDTREKPHKSSAGSSTTAIKPSQTPSKPIPYVDDGKGKNRVLWVCQVLASTPLGKKHATRIRVGRLLGGWLQGGLIPQDSMGAVVEIARQHSDRPDLAETELLQAIEHGRLTPITKLDQHIHNKIQFEKSQTLIERFNYHSKTRSFTR